MQIGDPVKKMSERKEKKRNGEEEDKVEGRYGKECGKAASTLPATREEGGRVAQGQ